jgi:hypothetical protein
MQRCENGPFADRFASAELERHRFPLQIIVKAQRTLRCRIGQEE